MDTSGPDTSGPDPETPAGWYPDPDQVGTQRYWNGSTWTDQRAPLNSPTIGQPQPGTNGLAVAALVLGIVWLGGLGAVLALIFGMVALNQISRTGARGKGMAISGIVLGALGILVPVVLFVAVGQQVEDDFQEVCNALEMEDC